MESDLDRSLRILETAISTKDKSLLHSSAQKLKKRSILSSTPSEVMRLELQNTLFSDISFSKTSGEIQRQNLKRPDAHSSFLNIIESDSTLTGSILQANKPWSTAAENLYLEFFETMQAHSHEHNAFDVLSDLASCCSDALNVIKGIKSKITIQGISEESWLEKERNIWRLLLVLMQDRLLTGSEEMEDELHFGTEKICVLNLFKRDSLLRECQLVIDWLEANASEREDEIFHFTENAVGWENSLHQLESPETIVFESSRKIVNKLDPDAPHYQKLPLHDIDQEDEERLCRKMFALIRCGNLQGAQKVCIDSGHSWRAALLEGWRLYHDPNTSKSVAEGNSPEDFDDENMDVDSTEKNNAKIIPVEGNKYRDIWKGVALEYCKKDYLNIYERAAVAAYCGHLDTLLSVCKTWEDCLWAYLRVLVDIKVESELRDTMPRIYGPLKDEYWEQRMSLNEVFEKIESSFHDEVSKSSKLPDYKIQKYIILDDISSLLEELNNWVEDSHASTQFLRFSAHLVLIFDELGLINDRSILNKSLLAYIDHLCELKETQLIAYYVSKLDLKKQVEVYASYLEQITDDMERREALKFGENCGLETLKVTKQIVSNIRCKPYDLPSNQNLQEVVTSSDTTKISALDWLLIYEVQRLELLEETNALIFIFLTMGKLECAKAAFAKVPNDAVDSILSDPDAAVSSSVNQVIREYLSYKFYLNAQEAFTEWFEQYNSKPLPPKELPENAQFTEKVAHQHRTSQFKAEMERWKLMSSKLANSTKKMLYNVLLFPEGWLTGAKDADYMRSKVIPECVLLVFTVLYESECYEECVQLADLIASEKNKLYKVYSKEKLGELLRKLAESSVALLNQNKDPWGQDASL